MKKQNFLSRVQTFVQKPDVKQNFWRALWRRLVWRARWVVEREPWLLPLPNGLRIAVPHAGSGALIYYQGWSEPEVANFLRHVLQPGMVFIDVGAHIGEYVLLASPIVGGGGQVHAFEPDPRNFQILKRNIIHLNKLQNVVVNPYAVDKQSGAIRLRLFTERSISRISNETDFSTTHNSEAFVQVSAVSLDDYVISRGIGGVDVIKIDVEGAEMFVLEGARSLLSRPKDTAPILVFEYSPSNCRSLGYEAPLILQMLKKYGYSLFSICANGRVVGIDTVEVPEGKHVNLVATKSEGKILSALARDNQ